MIALYRPGHSPIHRAPAAAKLIALAVASVLISLWPPSGVSITVVASFVVVLYVVAGLGLAPLVRQIVSLAWIIAFFVITVLIFSGIWAATSGAVRVVSIILLAGLVTLTTRMSDLLDVVERAQRPLQRWGVNPWRVAFVITLAIALVPVVAGFWRALTDAARARGLRVGIRLVVPLLVMSLRHADHVGDSISARGLG